MRFMRLISVLGLVATSSFAQGLTPLTIYPEDGGFSASFVSRPDWNRSGEGLIEISRSYFRGVGDHTNQAEIHGFHHWAADENNRTSEQYSIVFRSPLSSTNTPDSSANGLIARFPNLSTPTTNLGLPRGVFRIRDAFATPVIVPTDDTFFAGIDFPANPLWPNTDGHALFAAWVIAPAAEGEHPRAFYPRDITWSVTTRQNPFRVGATYLMGCLLDRPVLQIGGQDPASLTNGAHLKGTPNYGLGGLFPDISGIGRSDGLVLRMKNAAQPNASVFPFVSIGFGPQTPLPGIIGQLHLDPRVLLSVGSVSLVNGTVEQFILTPGIISPAFLGQTFTFQCLVMGGVRTFIFSNAQATVF